jgi:cytoskeletal protein CcmA (bactofilin family)
MVEHNKKERPMVFQSSKKAEPPTPYTVSQTAQTFHTEEIGHSIIGKGLTLKGEIVCHENLTVEGQIEGNITTRHQMNVGRNGLVKAEIKANNVRISGAVTGSIQADGRVEILSGGSFSGSLSSKRLVIQEGAVLQAEVKMEE